MYSVNETESRSSSRTLCCFLFVGVFIFAIGLAGGILIGIYVYHGASDSDNSGGVSEQCGPKNGNTDAATTARPPVTTAPRTGNEEECSLCKKRDPFVAYSGPQLFAPMTEGEQALVRETLIKNGIVSSKLGDNLSLSDDYILYMDIQTPRKVDALRYVDDNGPFPGRYAVVTVYRGTRNPPDVMQYQVGPLEDDVSTTRSVQKLMQDGDVSFNARPVDYWEFRMLTNILKPIEQTLTPLIRDSFDGLDFQQNFIFWWPYNAPPGFDEFPRINRLHAFLNPDMVNGDYHLLDMLPLSVAINCTSYNTNDWTVTGLYYLNQGPFQTASQLVEAYNNGSINKVHFPSNYKNTVAQRYFVGRDDSKPFRANANMPPPRTYEPEGPRYTIKGHRVSWMGWQFDVTTRMMRGPALFDIRFKSERIAYELSLNDIALLYAHDSPEKSNVLYTDATYGIGYYAGTVHSVDCPEHATILDTSFYNSFDGTTVTTKSICVFEADGEGPLWRHKVNQYYGGIRDTYLVVRIGSALINYDYIFEFHFKLDGKLNTEVTASGFIQTGFWYAENPNDDNKNDGRDAFGYRVTDFGHGLIHDHMFGFKVDMDILGTENIFETIHFKSGTALGALKTTNPSLTSKPDYFRLDLTRYLEYETIERETGYRLNPTSPKLWTFQSANAKNSWGANRGYQVAMGSTAVQTVSDNHPVLNAIGWTKYNLAITKRNESEQFISSLFDGFRLNNAKGNFDKILNNESIVGEDLVAWVAVGFVHVPTSEDVPMTNAVKTSFMLKPFNFFDVTEAFDMPVRFKSDTRDEMPPEFDKCLENNK